jgi:nucleoside-diphosphate-sugar epimerase
MTCVVVTGASGYIGRALSERLAVKGYRLRLVSRFPQTQSSQAPAFAEHVQADLDEVDWCRLIRNASAIVHLSARTDLKAAEADPFRDHDLNVKPVQALVLAARESAPGIPVIFASTATIVGPEHENPVTEATPNKPCSVYDRHKLACERILRDATQAGIVRACSLRLSNVYGHGRGVSSTNSNRGILNAMMRRAVEGKALTLYGTGGYVRDFIFLDDVVAAFQCALEAEQAHDGRHYVIASGRGHTLSEAFGLIRRVAFEHNRGQIEIRREPEPENMHPIERRNFIGDAARFAKLTGWRSRVDLETGIQDFFRRAADRELAASI